MEARAGRYTFELRRWPRELDLPLNAAYAPPAGNRESTPGRAIGGIKKARLRIGAVDKTVEVDDTQPAVRLTADLPAGPAELQTWLVSADGTERGAYYVYVRREPLS